MPTPKRRIVQLLVELLSILTGVLAFFAVAIPAGFLQHRFQPNSPRWELTGWASLITGLVLARLAYVALRALLMWLESSHSNHAFAAVHRQMSR